MPVFLPLVRPPVSNFFARLTSRAHVSVHQLYVRLWLIVVCTCIVELYVRHSVGVIVRVSLSKPLSFVFPSATSGEPPSCNPLAQVFQRLRRRRARQNPSSCFASVRARQPVFELFGARLGVRPLSFGPCSEERFSPSRLEPQPFASLRVATLSSRLRTRNS